MLALFLGGLNKENQTILEYTSRKSLIGKPTSRGTPYRVCATPKYTWRTSASCATGKHLAVAHLLCGCATTKLGLGRPRCTDLSVMHRNMVRHG